MMSSEPKSFASLGPTLLARKGGAKPAMRPQLPAMVSGGPAQAAAAIAHDLEDLGWNDMGHHDNDEPHQAQVLPLTPSPTSPQGEADTRAADRAAHLEMGDFEADEDFDDEEEAEEPEVRRQQRAVVASIGTARERSRRNAIEAGRRAAFTLRLDAKRHLKLRLASTVKNRSAQQLVTAALDKYLSEIPEVEALAAQVKRD